MGFRVVARRLREDRSPPLRQEVRHTTTRMLYGAPAGQPPCSSRRIQAALLAGVVQRSAGSAWARLPVRYSFRPIGCPSSVNVSPSDVRRRSLIGSVMSLTP